MKSRSFAFLASFAAVALFSSWASALTVTYTTIGAFNLNGGGDLIAPVFTFDDGQVGTNVLTNAAGNLHIGFTGQTLHTTSTNLPAINQLLGNFKLEANVTSGQPAASFDPVSTFELTLTQNAPPGAGPAGSSSNITGTIQYVASNDNSGSILIHFNPNPVFITGTTGGTYAYQLSDSHIAFSNSGPIPFDGGARLSADISVAPLPTPATAGLVLLAGFGGLQAYRRKSPAVMA